MAIEVLAGVRCDEGWLYLAVVMDVFGRKFVGCRCAPISARRSSPTRSRWPSPAASRQRA
jgi:hypothetical protein